MVIDVLNRGTTRSEEPGEGTAGTAETATDEFTVTVHLRASPTGVGARRQQSVLDRLRTLEAEGTVPELAVERWGKRVGVSESMDTRTNVEAVALYEEFQRVADRSGIRLEPFFEFREAVGGLLSSGPPTARVIVFPVISITIRRDGKLTGLYPCWSDGDHLRVEDCLDALEAGAEIANC